jgi:molybdate/tungstate transport system substrate-binding protein
MLMTEQRSRGAKRSRRTRRAFLATVGVSASVLAGCAGGGGGGGGGGETTTSGGETTTSGGNETMGSENGTTTGSSGGSQSMTDSITVFHAGSLAPPMEEAEAAFEEETGIQVNREAEGSVASTQKITQQGRSADVLGVADYRLIWDQVLPQYGEWYAVFATNSMTLAYTGDSAGAGEIGPGNWWEVLSQDNVRFAHSDPAADPNGYRSVMVMMLGMMDFQGSSYYGQDTYDTLREQEIVPTGTESALFGQLQAGSLDYIFEYTSFSATEDAQFLDFEPRVDLSRTTQEFADFYAQAEVQAGGETYTGAPIAYGITVPNVAEAPGAGQRFVEFMLAQGGDDIMTNAGFGAINPAVVPESAQQSVPGSISDLVEAQQSLGPLELDMGYRPPTYRSRTDGILGRTPRELALS